jgi:hypothetical protein
VAAGQEEAQGEGELAAHETVVRSQVRVPAAYSDQLRPLTRMCVSFHCVSCCVVRVVRVCVVRVVRVVRVVGSIDIGIDSQATGTGSRKRRACSCFCRVWPSSPNSPRREKRCGDT